MLVNLVEGAAWSGLGTPRFDPTGEHLAYPAREGERWRVVTDGRPGPILRELVEDSLYASAVFNHKQALQYKTEGKLLEAKQAFEVAADAYKSYLE